VGFLLEYKGFLPNFDLFGLFGEWLRFAFFGQEYRAERRQIFRISYVQALGRFC
jgi:hypothetical protein